MIWAHFDQPDLKATFKLNIIHPHEWIVLSNENHYVKNRKFNI